MVCLQQNLESLLETKIKSDTFKSSDFLEEKPSKSAYPFSDNSFLEGFLSGTDCLNGVSQNSHRLKLFLKEIGSLYDR